MHFRPLYTIFAQKESEGPFPKSAPRSILFLEEGCTCRNSTPEPRSFSTPTWRRCRSTRSFSAACAAFALRSRRVCKTQISLSCGRVFACASFLRVLPKAKLPPASFVLTLGLPAPLLSPRVAARTEAYPGRWTHHIVLSRREDLDAELFSWVRQALDFAQK